MSGNLDCPQCAHLATHGRARTSDPVHCVRCHLTWTGNEAQHCITCHHTFTAITAADAHRLPGGGCIDPAATDGWREIRPNVWTNGTPWSAGTWPENPAETSQRPDNA